MFYMRHGESVSNARMNKTGQNPHMPDPPLSSFGEKQVYAAAARLKGAGFTKIITSPYQRALQTALIVKERLELPLFVEPLIGERRLYSCDIGSPVETLKEKWPELDFSRMPEKKEWWLPFNESGRDLQKRIQSFQNEWGWQDDADRTLVVSHWYFINAATGSYPENAEVVAG